MIEASTRYVPHIAALIVLAAIPTLLHSLGRFDVDDCANSQGLLAPPDVDHAAMLSAGERHRIDTYWGAGNWSAGTLGGEGPGASLRYVIVRSFDPKTVYHWPEGRVLDHRHSSRGLEEVEGPGGVQLPVHRAFYEPRGADTTVVAYLLVYDSQAVANPYLAQILAGPKQVLLGRRPMWLFLVYGEVEKSAREDAEQRAREWLASAWERHRTACAR